MRAITTGELAKKIVELLGIREGEPFEIARTRDGQVLVRKPNSTGA